MIYYSADFYKIEGGVLEYYKKNDMLTEDSVKNRLIVEGVAYSLYCKTSYPKTQNIVIRGMGYSLKENAELFKSIYKETKLLEDFKNKTSKILEKLNEFYKIEDGNIEALYEKISAETSKSSAETEFKAENTELLKEKPDATLGLATGSSPIGLYQNLIKKYQIFLG